MNTFAERVMARKRVNKAAKEAAHAQLEREIRSIADPELRNELMDAYNIPEKSSNIVAAAA